MKLKLLLLLFMLRESFLKVEDGKFLRTTIKTRFHWMETSQELLFSNQLFNNHNNNQLPNSKTVNSQLLIINNKDDNIENNQSNSKLKSLCTKSNRIQWGSLNKHNSRIKANFKKLLELWQRLLWVELRLQLPKFANMLSRLQRKLENL